MLLYELNGLMGTYINLRNFMRSRGSHPNFASNNNIKP